MSQVVRWKEAKKTSEWPLTEVKASFEVVDKAFKALILTDSAGNQVRLTGGYSYPVEFFVPTTPPTTKKWEVKGEILGVKVVPQRFDCEFDAKQYVHAATDEVGAKAILTIDEVEVPEE